MLCQHCHSLNKIYNYVYNHQQPNYIYIYFISIYGCIYWSVCQNVQCTFVDTETVNVFAVVLGYDLTIGLP